jgi:hypothetical protein
MSKPGLNPAGKLPVPVSVVIRGPLGEFPASAVDVNPLGMEIQSPRRLTVNERIGLTLKCDAVRGPGVQVSADVRACREDPGPSYNVKVDFQHAGDTEKRLQKFLWDLDDAGRKKRQR